MLDSVVDSMFFKYPNYPHSPTDQYVGEMGYYCEQLYIYVAFKK